MPVHHIKALSRTFGGAPRVSSAARMSALALKGGLAACAASNQGMQVRKGQRRGLSSKRGALQVVAGKGRRSRNRGGQMQQQPQRPEDMPVPDIPIDPENPQFVIFVRSTKLPFWYPVNVITGGPQAKVLLRTMESPFGQALVESNLLKQIGKSLYENKQDLLEGVYKQYPTLQNAEALQFGMRVLDKEDVRRSLMPNQEGIKIIPPEEDCKMVMDQAKDAVQDFNIGRLFGGGKQNAEQSA